MKSKIATHGVYVGPDGSLYVKKITDVNRILDGLPEYVGTEQECYNYIKNNK